MNWRVPGNKQCPTMQNNIKCNHGNVRLHMRHALSVIRRRSVTCNRIISMSTGLRFRVLYHDQSDHHGLHRFNPVTKSYLTTSMANLSIHLCVFCSPLPRTPILLLLLFCFIY